MLQTWQYDNPEFLKSEVICKLPIELSLFNDGCDFIRGTLNYVQHLLLPIIIGFIAMTEQYTHLSPENVLAAVSALEGGHNNGHTELNVAVGQN